MNKIKYEFVDGASNEVEVSDGVFIQYLVLEKYEEIVNRRETRHHESLYAMHEKGKEFGSIEDEPFNVINKRTEVKARLKQIEMLNHALTILLPAQRKLLKNIYIDGVKSKDIAKQEGVCKQAISNRLARIYERLVKYLK